jgi:hypothetical protein
MMRKKTPFNVRQRRLQRIRCAKKRMLYIVLFGLIILTDLASSGAASQPALSQTSTKYSDPGYDSKIQAEILPSSIELPPGGNVATAILILRNIANFDITNIRVMTTADESLTIQSIPPLEEPRALSGRGEISWVMKLSSTHGSPHGPLNLVVTYTQTEAGKPRGKITTTRLDIARRDGEEIVAVKVSPETDSIDQQHPRKVFLFVTNKTDRSIKIKGINFRGPKFLEVKEWGDNKNITNPIVAGQQTIAIPVDLTASSRVEPGKHTIAYAVSYEFIGSNLESGVLSDDQLTNSGEVVVSQTMDVGILAESAILKVLEVPSIFFMPGFLAVVTWSILWSWGVLEPEGSRKKFPDELVPKPSNPQFWVVSITVSIILIACYILFYNHHFLNIYGLRDILILWFISVVIIGVFGYCIVRAARNYYIQEITPSEYDDPIKLLKRLRWQRLNLFPGKVELFRDKIEVVRKVNGEDKNLRAYIFEKSVEGNDFLWVGPSIKVTYKNANDGQIRLINEQLKAGGSLKKLARALEKGSQDGTIIVKWASSSEGTLEITGVCKVGRGDIKNKLGPDQIIVIE